jgi:tetratricopeptide (TPR) repeat protein
MVKGKQARVRNKQRKLERKRRREKHEKRNSTPLDRQPAAKLAAKIDDAYDLIQVRKFAAAEELLDRLKKRCDPFPALVEAQLYLYQTIENHERCCEAAKQLAELTPHDPDARLMYAQESMFCARIGIALVNYQLFLQRWPNHANAEKAKNAIELIEPECEANIRGMRLGDASLDLLVMHEEALECMQGGEFEDAAEKCLNLLKIAPDCTSARNNLALSYFQSGNVEKAVHVAEETCGLAIDNRFAEATLGKLRFLSGDLDEAGAIADRIVVNPPTEQDPLAAAIELLSFLGRDEDIVVLSQAAEDREIVDPRCQAVLLHHLAVAQCRLNDERAARSSWTKCLEAMPTLADARENLADLDSGEGHAPWAESIGKWIPRAVCDNMFNRENALSAAGHLNLADDCPALAALIPALLDRGDPVGREMAMRMAADDGSPTMLKALQDFALGSRGPDKMRHEALSILGRKGRVDYGPHRFYSSGEWIEIKLFMAEISWEPEEGSPWAQDLVETGTEALSCGDFALAEESFNTILSREPDNCSAAYNLCVVWLNRDGEEGRRRAQARMEEIHEQFPDYLFAAISLAQFAALDREFERAGRLLEPILDAKKLHASEAIALFTAQIQIALQRREFGSAEQAFSVLVQIADEDDPRVAELRRRIDTAARKRGLGRLLPWA